MEIIPFIIISIMCGYLCWASYREGLKEGAERVIQVLHEKKVISYDDTGQIYPNPFFKKI